MDGSLPSEFPKTAPQGETLPAPGEMKEIAPRLYWLRMLLPFALDHINLWVLDEGDSWTLVDTGLDNRETQEVWQGLFAGPMAGKPVRRLLVTHHHPDHFGLAGWLTKETGAQLEMSDIEFDFGNWLWHLPDETWVPRMRAYYLEQGLPEETAVQLTSRGNLFRTRCGEPPASAQTLPLGGRVEAGGRTWRVVPGHGHVEGHACLYCEEDGLFIAGDQLLPSISPNVSVHAWNSDADPLSAFIETQQRLTRTIDDRVLVLPSHGRPFFGGAFRAQALVDHHEDRLERAEAACREAPKTAYEAIPALFNRKLDNHQMFFAIGEALSHLNHLAVLGRAEKRREGGVARFSA